MRREKSKSKDKKRLIQVPKNGARPSVKEVSKKAVPFAMALQQEFDKQNLEQKESSRRSDKKKNEIMYSFLDQSLGTP